MDALLGILHDTDVSEIVSVQRNTSYSGVCGEQQVHRRHCGCVHPLNEIKRDTGLPGGQDDLAVGAMPVGQVHR